jgi:hypothetical protein
VWRVRSSHDVLGAADEPGPEGGEPLLVPVMRDGARTDAGQATLDDAAARLREQWVEIPDETKRLRDPAPYPVEVSEALPALASDVDRARSAPSD